MFALLAVPVVAWLVASAAANRPGGFKSLSRPLVVLIVAAVALCVATWLVRLIVSTAVPVERRAGPGAFAPTGA